jgi:hypothetical protein
MFTSFVFILITTVTQLLSLIGIILFVGLILDLLQRKSVGYISNTFGGKAYFLTAWIGTPIHELGHAIMCIIFRHRIIEVQWFPVKSNVSYFGYVRHNYNERSIYQRIGHFFIGIGPFFSGILSLILLMYFFVPESYLVFTDYLDHHVQPEHLNKEMIVSIFLSSWVLLKSLFTLDHLVDPYFWIFLLLATCISTHIALSKSDIKGAASGLLSIFFLLFFVNILGMIFHFDSNKWVSLLASYHTYTIAFSSLAILFSFMTFVSCFLIYQLSKGKH